MTRPRSVIGLDCSRLVHDWDPGVRVAAGRISFNDETLRDGLQSTSARHPEIEERVRFLHLLPGLGIEAANVGFPGAGARAHAEAEALVREIATAGLAISPQCAARTVEADLRPIAEIAQRAGIGVEVGLFLGCSPLRRRAEGWEIDDMVRLTARTVASAVREGLRVLFVTEDTTRSRPDDLRMLYQAAVRSGAGRVCVADTVGFATPAAASRLVSFVAACVREAGGDGVGIDWHGHNDRGLAVSCALAAAEAGADRLHGTALGVGERCGNAPMEQLLVNARLLGWVKPDLKGLMAYVACASRMLGVAIPAGVPVVGAGAFATATGVHAAALLKALHQNDSDLLEQVYSAIPASWLGRAQDVEIGPFSGASNVEFWLIDRGYQPSPDLVTRILGAAKAASGTLADDEIHRLVRAVRAGMRAL